MIYVALLRGINVGGNRKVEMAKLNTTFQSLGFSGVTTYINSGNVIFKSENKNSTQLVSVIERGIEKDFGFKVHVVLRDLASIREINKNLPKSWTNDTNIKIDVMFLWDVVDSPKVLEQVIIKSRIDYVKYIPGALLWRVDRININKSGLLRIVGTELYKKMTIRNVNTLRRLRILMEDT